MLDRANLEDNRSGFTIVELIVVVVVIGILSAISFISYSGVSQRARLASVQSDLSNASTKLKIFLAENNAYPESVTDCPNPQSTNICLKPSPGNTYSYSVNNSVNPPVYSLSVVNSNVYQTTSSSQTPTVLSSAPLGPTSDWLALSLGNHYGNFYDLVSHNYATVTRSTPKTIYDSNAQKIYDVPANSLGVRPRSDGKSGAEAEIEEGRTNYLVYSYFSNDVNSDGLSDGWSSSASNSINTYQLIDNNPIYSNRAQKFRAVHIDNTATGYPNLQQSTSAGSFSAGNSVTASMYYKGLSKQGQNVYFYIQPRDSSNVNIGGSTTVALTTSSSWQRATVGIPSLPAGTSKILVSLAQQSQSSNGDFFDIEIGAVQLEKGAFATSYIPTTSTSATRNADYVGVPTSRWSSSQGTFLVTANMPGGGWQSAVSWVGVLNPFAIASGTYGNTRISYNATNYANAVATAGGYRTAAGKWNATTGSISAYYNGSGVTYNGTPWSVNPSSTSYIGSYATTVSNGSQFYNGSIQRFTVYPSALSDTDVSLATAAVRSGP